MIFNPLLHFKTTFKEPLHFPGIQTHQNLNIIYCIKFSLSIHCDVFIHWLCYKYQLINLTNSGQTLINAPQAQLYFLPYQASQAYFLSIMNASSHLFVNNMFSYKFVYQSKNFIFSNKVDLSQETSFLISRKRQC